MIIFILVCLAIAAFIVLAAWLGSDSGRDKTLGTGRPPEQPIKDPDWKPSKIKGQHGQWPGF